MVSLVRAPIYIFTHMPERQRGLIFKSYALIIIVCIQAAVCHKYLKAIIYIHMIYNYCTTQN